MGGDFDWQGINEGLGQVAQGARIGREEREAKAERTRIREERENERRLRLAEIRYNMTKDLEEDNPARQAAFRAYEAEYQRQSKTTDPLFGRKTIPGKVVQRPQGGEGGGAGVTSATGRIGAGVTSADIPAGAPGVGVTSDSDVSPGAGVTSEQAAAPQMVQEPGRELLTTGGSRDLTRQAAADVYQSVYNQKLTPEQQAYFEQFRSRHGRPMTWAEFQQVYNDPELRNLFPPPQDPKAVRAIYESNITRMRADVQTTIKSQGATPQNIVAAMTRYNQAVEGYRENLRKLGLGDAEINSIIQPFTNEDLQMAIRGQAITARQSQQAVINDVRSAQTAFRAAFAGNSEAAVRESVKDVNNAKARARDAGLPSEDLNADQVVLDWKKERAKKGAPTGADPVKLINYKIANNIELTPSEQEYMKRFPHKFQPRGRSGGRGGGQRRRTVY